MYAGGNGGGPAAVEVAMVGTQLAQMPSGVASYYLFLGGLLIDPAVVMTI